MLTFRQTLTLKYVSSPSFPTVVSSLLPMSPKPVIVFVPGAWHSPSHYSELFKYLHREGLNPICQRNPSCDCANPHETSTAGDAAFIRKLILAQIDAGNEVVLAMHSYGGCPGGAAAKGLSKSERQAAGLPGGVIGLIYVCAFVANEGDSLIGKLPGAVHPDWVVLHVRYD